MKTKKGFMLRCIAGKYIVVTIGQASIDFNGLIELSESGAFLWEKLTKGASYEDLVSAVLAEYEDAPEDIVRHDIDAFLETARKANLIDED